MLQKPFLAYLPRSFVFGKILEQDLGYSNIGHRKGSLENRQFLEVNKCLLLLWNLILYSRRKIEWCYPFSLPYTIDAAHGDSLGSIMP